MQLYQVKEFIFAFPLVLLVPLFFLAIAESTIIRFTLVAVILFMVHFKITSFVDFFEVGLEIAERFEGTNNQGPK